MIQVAAVAAYHCVCACSKLGKEHNSLLTSFRFSIKHLIASTLLIGIIRTNTYFVLMTLYEFLQADEFEKASAVWDGVFIAERVENGSAVLLYQINSEESFYVEVYYQPDYNEIGKFRAFKSLDLLDPYLEGIEIPV